MDILETTFKSGSADVWETERFKSRNCHLSNGNAGRAIISLLRRKEKKGKKKKKTWSDR